ncbi:tyrosine-type recombinase/integrase [Microbacterium pygmaeum]|uniref:tyrosine-type recombinase/integrase n=1 Tax=Microbacterium pygmaeum TaxID=370764 RepID=UPI0012FC33B6|nr:site-specific integrase [Microbacterium pygmaeum]
MLIRGAARDWRKGEGYLGPRPDGQVRDLIEVMLGSATRIGEALALRKCDVDMTVDPPVVSVNGTIVVRKGVGLIRQPKPKTDDSNRVVSVPPFAAGIIERRLAALAHADEDHLLFHTRNGTPLAPHNARRTFRAMLKSVGLDGAEITPHAFRRTGATLIAREVNIEAAAEVLGHSTTATTKEHYAEPDRSASPVSATVLQKLAPAP